ncbi:MAG: tyrosine-type recombinase/integrase [Verrucomicrobiota bacterium]
MIKQRRIAENPLLGVERVDIRGKQQLRRAYTDEELNRLLSVAGRSKLLYLSATYTGLRLGELMALLWADVHLSEDRPYLLARASTTKNNQKAIVPIHPLLIPQFQKAKTGAREEDHVFQKSAHPDRQLSKHFQEAGLAKIDATGRKLDFHSFRYTFATKLARQGI